MTDPFRHTRYELLIHGAITYFCCYARKQELLERFGQDAQEVGYLDGALLPCQFSRSCGISPCLKEV